MPEERRPARRAALALGALVLVGVLLAAGIRLASLWSVGRIGLYQGTTYVIARAPERGFHAPYLAYVPASLEPGEPFRLWLRPNNSGSHDDPDLPLEDARKQLAVSRWQAEALRAVVLVPAFPRPQDQWRVYTHALDRDTVLAEPPLGRPDLQLLAMADDVVRHLDGPVCETVFVDGYSASGMFADRFTAIHPERVEAAVIGAPGGWPLAPVDTVEGEPLPWPAGTADYAELFGRPVPLDAWRATPLLFHLGDRDTNDSVPYEDGYEAETAARVNRLFGQTPVDRWPAAARMHEGFDATFRLDQGLGHETPRSVKDARLAFFAAHDDRSACR